MTRVDEPKYIGALSPKVKKSKERHGVVDHLPLFIAPL